jgi:hypothetical protein
MCPIAGGRGLWKGSAFNVFFCCYNEIAEAGDLQRSEVCSAHSLEGKWPMTGWPHLSMSSEPDSIPTWWMVTWQEWKHTW